MIRVLIAALAGTRLTRAWAHETIGELFRIPIETWAAKISFTPVEQPDGTVEVVVTEPAWKLAVKPKIEELVGCSHCMGFWLTLGCVIAHRWKVTQPLVEALAAAALVSAVVEQYPGFDPHADDAD